MISLPVFPSRINLHDISVTPKLIKKITTNLEGWKVSSVVPPFENVGETTTTKNYCPVRLLSVVSKVFEKYLSNRLVDHQEICGLFSDFQYSFRSSPSTPDFLTCVSDGSTGRAFNRFSTTRIVILDISNAFDRVCHGGLRNFRFYGISGQIFGLMSSYLNNRLLRFVLDGKSSLECLVNAGIPQGSILGPFLHFSYHRLFTFLMMLSVILISMLMILLSTLSVIGI